MWRTADAIARLGTLGTRQVWVGLVAQNSLVLARLQALGAGPMSWSPEMHAYRVAARGGTIRSWEGTGTL